VFGANLIPHHPTLDNFLYVFTQVDFFRYLWNTFFVSATVTIVALVLPFHGGICAGAAEVPGTRCDLSSRCSRPS
jgi:multiple sugar transport system permease protein